VMSDELKNKSYTLADTHHSSLIAHHSNAAAGPPGANASVAGPE